MAKASTPLQTGFVGFNNRQIAKISSWGTTTKFCCCTEMLVMKNVLRYEKRANELWRQSDWEWKKMWKLHMWERSITSEKASEKAPSKREQKGPKREQEVRANQKQNKERYMYNSKKARVDFETRQVNQYTLCTLLYQVFHFSAGRQYCQISPTRSRAASVCYKVVGEATVAQSQIRHITCATGSSLMIGTPMGLSFGCPRLECPDIAYSFWQNAILGCKQAGSTRRFRISVMEDIDGLSRSQSVSLKLRKMRVRVNGDSR